MESMNLTWENNMTWEKMCDRMRHVQGPQTHGMKQRIFLEHTNFLAYSERYE